MRSVLKRAALLAAPLLVFAGGPASAAVLEVKVPFPFVVQGQPFPAGQYRLERDEADQSVVLIRGERRNTPSMFVLTNPAPGHDPAGKKPAVTFKRYENQHRLADIWESAARGREVTVAR
jgi:hypothetical protein